MDVQFALRTSPGLCWMMKQNQRRATLVVLVWRQKIMLYKSGNHHNDKPSPLLPEEQHQPWWVLSLSLSWWSPWWGPWARPTPVTASLGQLWIISISRARTTPTVTTPVDLQLPSELPGVSLQFQVSSIGRVSLTVQVYVWLSCSYKWQNDMSDQDESQQI